ncbi:purine nucleoside permease [Alteromonas sp. 5E99-2]|uniref:purine nucleoside permease n=1 Tax=Alteromonas sp. 5E99-2 TaxID=2817683 RepID=UPI001A98CFA7|nr:purine nucleoside permease [Alteromonas sp. 5E99-2]MBO1254372.1 purine nucleoside permease [Alteromonas sp. 5E99-2]
MKKLIILILSMVAITACTSEAPTSESGSPIEIKAVVITMFEIGEDEGDKPGEFQLWKENYGLNKKFEFPQGHHDLYLNTEKGVLGIVTGMGMAKASTAIMALGLDPRFDFTHAYWLVAGIAGIDPEDGTLGTAAWAEYIIDGDLAHEIDSREIPKDWTTGYFPLFANEPYPTQQSTNTHHAPNGEFYQLNGGLVNWAFDLTKNIKLQDTDAMLHLRSQYVEHPLALEPPKVIKGDQVAASTFWHGKLMNQWANDWTQYWTKGKGNFVTSAMEDTGSYQALIYLTNAGKADKSRFMVLRTASNFTMQPPGLTAAQNLAAESAEAGYAGMNPALNAAYVVGSTVLDEIVDNWDSYKIDPPSK